MQGIHPTPRVRPSSQWVLRLALLLLCAAYLQGGLVKLSDFGAARAEMTHFGLAPAWLAAALVLALELGGSALVVIGYWRWPAALALALFTLAATFLANRYWELSGVDRFMAENGFYEHLGLVGGFVLVAWMDLRERARA